MGASQFGIFGEVRIDTGPAVEGVKEIRSAIGGLGTGGIAGFQTVRQKVIDLTKSVGELRNALLQTSDPAKQKELNAALDQTKTQLTAARAEMRGMTMETRQTNEAVQRLAGSIGVQIPAGLERMLARMPAVQAAVEGAFGATVVLAFGAAIVSSFPKIAEWIDKLRGVEAVNNEFWKEIIETNRVLSGWGKPDSVKALAREFGDVAKEIARVKKELAETPAPLPPAPFVAPMANVYKTDNAKALREELGRLQEQYTELEKAIPKAEMEEHKRAIEKQTEAAKKLHAAQERWVEQEEKLRISLAGSAEASLKAAAAEGERAEALNAAFNEMQRAVNQAGMADVGKWAADLSKQSADAWGTISRLDKEAADKRTSGLEGLAKIEADYQHERLRIEQETNEAIVLDARTLYANRDEILRASANAEQAIEQERTTKILAFQREAVQKTANEIEGFIDRVFLTARSLGDVFHQFLTQLLSSFVKWTSRMISEAVHGMQLSSGQGGGGGVLSSIFGGIFGTGGGTTSALGGGVTGGISLSAGETAALQSGLGGGGFAALAALPAGAGIPSVAGGATGGALGALAFGKINFLQMAALAGPVAALGGIGGLMRATGPASGAVYGGIAGAGIMASLGAVGGMASGIGAAAGVAAAFTNPITAAIVGAAIGIGALVGALGRGRAKERAAGAEQGYEFASNDLLKQFKGFELDYQSALAGMESLIQQGVQAEYALGTKWGKKGAENLTNVINDNIKALEALQKQRELNAAMIGGMTIPEFAIGGPVGWRTASGGVLAIVHPGEFMMRREAVDALGTNFLAALNRAPRFAEGGPVMPISGSGLRPVTVNLNIYQLPGEDQQRFANRVVRAVRRAAMDGALR